MLGKSKSKLRELTIELNRKIWKKGKGKLASCKVFSKHARMTGVRITNENNALT
jgi:ribosomal protein L31E